MVKHLSLVIKILEPVVASYTMEAVVIGTIQKSRRPNKMNKETLIQCGKCDAVGTNLEGHECNPEKVAVQFSLADRNRILNIAMAIKSPKSQQDLIKQIRGEIEKLPFDYPYPPQPVGNNTYKDVAMIRKDKVLQLINDLSKEETEQDGF